MTVLPFPTRRAPVRHAHPTPFADLVPAFLLDLQVAGRASWTRRKHGQELRRYGRWLDSQELAWCAADLRDLRAYLRERAHLSASARASTVCSLRVFYGWAVEQGHLAVSPAAGLATPSRPKPTPKALTRAQMRQLLAALAAQSGPCARRDEILVLTGLYTGLRALELSNLRWSDVDLDEGIITIEISKMQHGRATASHPDLTARLRAWRDVQSPPSAYIFADVRHGEKVSAARVGKIVRAVARACGLPELHTHRLRHSFATWTLRASKDLHSVSKALGHKELKQTEVYIAAALGVEAIAEAVAKLPGPQDW